MENQNSMSYESPWFPESELKLLDAAVSALPKAIETKLRLEHVFSLIHQKLISGVDAREILEVVFTSLEKVLPFDRIGIALLENNNQNIRLCWVKSKLTTGNIDTDFTSPLNGSSLRTIIESQRPRIINDLSAYLREHPSSTNTKLILKDGIQSNLTCPLVFNGTTIGVIFFSSSSPGTYTKEHMEVFCEIAQGLSLIIDQGLMKKRVDKIDEKEKMFTDTLHDLNNPLWVIKSALDLIERRDWYKNLGEDSKKMFSILKRNCDTMIRMVRQIVYTVREQKGEGTHGPEEVSLQTFVNSVLDDALMMSSEKKMHIALDLQEQLPAVLQFDSKKVKQALENIIANAIKFSSRGSRLILQASLDPLKEKLQFTVSDQGPGIEEDVLKTIFQEKKEKLGAGKKKKLSSGRGLPNVKRLIQTLGGDVSVQSSPGEGSSFTIWIPVKTKNHHWH